MVRLYHFAGISVLALCLFGGNAMAHDVPQHKAELKKPTVVKAIKKPHQEQQHKALHDRFKRLIAVELKKPNPNLRKVRKLRLAMLNLQRPHQHKDQQQHAKKQAKLNHSK